MDNIMYKIKTLWVLTSTGKISNNNYHLKEYIKNSNNFNHNK